MSASNERTGTDLAKLDAYVNTATEYDEIPEASAKDFARGVIELNGVPVRPKPQTDATHERADQTENGRHKKVGLRGS